MVSVIIQKYHAIHLIRGCRVRGDAGARRLRPRPARSLQTHSSFQLHLICYLVNYFAIVIDCILFLFCPFYINRSIIIFILQKIYI